jgi:hypothetical protein
MPTGVVRASEGRPIMMWAIPSFSHLQGGTLLCLGFHPMGARWFRPDLNKGKQSSNFCPRPP